MTLRELVETCTFEDLIPVLVQLCGGHKYSLPDFKILYDGLRFREVIPSNDKIMIQKGDSSTEDDVWYHVNMFCTDEQETYGFCGIRDEKLSMEVVLDEGISLSNAEIVANCIHEMTILGFNDREIRGNIEGIIEDTEEFRMANALNYKTCLFKYPVSAKQYDRKIIPENVGRQFGIIHEECFGKERAMNGPKRKRMRRWEKRIKYLQRRSKIKLIVKHLVNNTDFEENDVNYLFDTQRIYERSFVSCADNILTRAFYLAELISDYLFVDYTEYTRFCLMFKSSSEHPITSEEKEQLGKIKDLLPQESTITRGYGINENLGENIELLFLMSR